MLTNKLNVTYNFENIDKDFDIFLVEKANKDYYKHNILDSATQDFKAVAVQWSFGAKALVMFRKGEVTEDKFKESITKEYSDVKIQKVDIFDCEQRDKCFYHQDRLLAQLLFNSMRTPKHNEFMYNNLTGKLLYHNPTWRKLNRKTGKIDYIYFLEIVLDPDMYLNLDLKTYKRYEYEGSGLYVIDANTGEFRKKLKSDINAITYKMGSRPNKHFRVDFFNVKEYKYFVNSKLGVMECFLCDVKEKLSRYITVEIVERMDVQKYEISKLEKYGIKESEYGELLQKKGVAIVDENGTEESFELICKLKEELEKYFFVEPTVGKLSRDAYNIRIIHDSEYYDVNDMYDLHNDDMKGYIVQHMTEEVSHFTKDKKDKKDEKCSPAIRKIIQELIIKGDVSDKEISIFDWCRLDSGKEWTFVVRRRAKDIDVDNINNERKVKYYDYYRLRIDKSGKLLFDTYCDMDEDETGEWQKICSAYNTVEIRHYGAKDIVEGLVYSNIRNIQAILLTKEKTLPNISVLMDTLKKSDVNQKVSKQIILEALEGFEKESVKDIEKIFGWREQLLEETEMITKKQIKKILNMRCDAASRFNRYLDKNYGVLIDGELRKGEMEAHYQISNILDIKYEYIENDFLDGEAFKYYVGAKSTNPRLAYPNACCVRKVVSLGDKVEFEEMLPLMAVDFVRNSQYTVLPFPFKYLREYIEQCE